MKKDMENEEEGTFKMELNGLTEDEATIQMARNCSLGWEMEANSS